jgi:TPR repeat protein
MSSPSSKRAKLLQETVRMMPSPETVLESCDKIVEDDEKKAEEGDVDAMHRLADWYGERFDEVIPPVDERRATQWRNRAAVQQLKKWVSDGDTSLDPPGARWAMFELGNVFQSGKYYGVEQDSYEAFNWFKKSADAGYPAALAKVGLCKLHGWGTNKNVTSGLALVSSAARDGSDLACFILGECFYRCKYGIEKDVVQAKKWLAMAVGDGEKECRCRVLHVGILIDDEHLSNARKWLEEIEREEELHVRGRILV